MTYDLAHPIPEDEDIRLRILESYEIFDTPPEVAFDRITSIVAKVTQVPIVTVTLIDRDRQYFKSCFGLSHREDPRSVSFCSYALLEGGKPLVVEDATKDERFCDFPNVTGYPHIRFYAGIPIHDKKTGVQLGTLCTIDTTPRAVTTEELNQLCLFASIVEDELELRLRNKETNKSLTHFTEMYETVSNSMQELQDNLVTMIPHELRTPLNGMLALSELLKDDWKKMESFEIDELLEIINSSGDSLNKVVTRLCLYSELKIQLHSIPSEVVSLLNNHTSVDVLNVIESTPSIVKAYAHDCAEIEIEIDPISLNIEASRLGILFEELIDNALKFSNSPKLMIKGTLEKDGYSVLITDNGVGIDNENLKKFDALRQFNQKLQEHQGWGMGLAIVNLICSIYDLKIDFQSKLGVGTSINILFPQSQIYTS